MSEALAPFVQGMVLQASLIAALGAQNLFVLESGLTQRKPWAVAAVSSLCDAALIVVGVAGAATVFVAVPELQIILGVLGTGFLAWYGLLKVREGMAGGGAKLDGRAGTSRPLLAALAFSLLNPHVYLDTVVLIGGFSARFDALPERLVFGAGAALFSLVWFFGLVGFGARMAGAMGHARGRQAFAFGSAAILLSFAVILGAEVAAWTQRYWSAA